MKGFHYGRLFRTARFLACLLVGFLGFGLSLNAVACSSSSGALSRCQAQYPNGSNGYFCGLSPAPVAPNWEVDLINGDGRNGGTYAADTCDTDPKPRDKCKAMKSFYSTFAGDSREGQCSDGCGFVVDPSQGITILQGAGAQLMGATFVPTGDTCDGSGGGSTNPPSAPNVPPDGYKPPVPTPDICGGGSCYDSASGQACAVSGGVQICIPVPTTPAQPGGCASGGGGAICVGNPPPMPANPPIGNPTKDVRSSDDYSNQTIAPDGTPGPVNNVTVNVYGQSSSVPISNGKGTSDIGSGSISTPGSGTNPASGSTAAGNGNTSSGGGDCNSPPVCSGDQILCNSLSQEFATRCAFSLPASASSGSVDPAAPTASQVMTTDDGDGSGDVSGGAPYGLSTQSWLSRTCPSFPTLELYGQSFDINNPAFCDTLTWMSYLVVLTGFMVSIRILGS